MTIVSWDEEIGEVNSISTDPSVPLMSLHLGLTQLFSLTLCKAALFGLSPRHFMKRVESGHRDQLRT